MTETPTHQHLCLFCNGFYPCDRQHQYASPERGTGARCCPECRSTNRAIVARELERYRAMIREGRA